ncbi:D-glycero-alpha-D-manno-heptose-1,7-bisphosphate 7-phosphatase [Coraliomargarita sp. W4R53]
MQNVWRSAKTLKSIPRTAVFADRDGTLIRHIDYIDDPQKVELLPGVKESVQRLLKAEIPLFILTNQSGVGRGYFPIERVYQCQEKLFELLEIEATQIAGWCIAPEAPGSEGGYRKPSPRFIHEACAQLELPSSACHMIGDTLVDLETAWNSGAHAWAVACGKPHLPELIAAGAVSGELTLKDDFPACIDAILSA